MAYGICKCKCKCKNVGHVASIAHSIPFVMDCALPPVGTRDAQHSNDVGKGGESVVQDDRRVENSSILDRLQDALDFIHSVIVQKTDTCKAAHRFKAEVLAQG